MDVGTLVARAAARYGDRIALDGPQGRQTFAELGDRVTRLARGLLGLGLKPGDRVLDLQPNQNTYVETDLALATAGLVRVALNYRLHRDDWARIAEDSGAVAIIRDERYDPGLDLPYEIVIGRDYEQIMTPGAVEAHHDLVSLNYTSGTTGRPKGVRRTHRNRYASLMNMTYDVLGGPPGPSDVYLHAGPITHTSGLFVLPFLAAGSTQVILPSFTADGVIEAVKEKGVTHTALVPTMVARLLAAGASLAELKMLAYAGAPMPPEQIRQALTHLTPNLVQYYGLVEAIPPVTVLDAADHQVPELLTSAGRPAIGCELRIVDGDGRTLPDGEIGEVLTRGEHVMGGYWGEAGDTHKVVRDGWLHTGDLGRIADGRLWLVDRKGDMIITGGYNVYPSEVENVIAEVAGVAEVAVIGVPDADWGQRIVALYTGTAEPSAVEEHCRARMASYKKPKQVIRRTEFPLNSTGKIAKNVLRAEYGA
ncbi:class I adenylate-forming enzyme family protein [Longispora albida]|uniref:class I adenylate-forming enzyme family protein n=1 Tax=Longispora albida TaxID=203523 RepID=UPI000367076D|nr:AMP-binding protein [Longispora albida]